MPANRALAVVMAAVLSSWALCAAALDREGAIEAAKRQVNNKCSSTAPCAFTAKVEKDKWYVRVEFPKGNSPKDKPRSHAGGHAIFIINQSGKVVGRIERE